MAGGRTIAGDMQADGLAFRYIDQEIASKANIAIQNASYDFGENRLLKGSAAHWDDAHFYKHPLQMELNGNLKIQDADFHIEDRFALSGNFETTSAFKVIREERKFAVTGSAKLDKGDIRVDQDRRLAGTVMVKDTEVSGRDSGLDIKTHFETQDSDAHFKDQELIGDTSGELDLSINPKQERSLIFKGSVDLHDAIFNGIAALGKIDAINGKVTFRDNAIASSSLKLKALDADVTVNGKLTNFLQPHLDVNATADHVDLQVFQKFLPPSIRAWPQVIPHGSASLSLTFRGPLADYQKSQLKFGVGFHNATLPLAALFHNWSSPPPISPDEEITNISGTVDYADNIIAWKNVTGTWKRQDYILNGRITNFGHPVLETQLTSTDLDLSTQIALSPSSLDLSRFKGTFYGSFVDGDGTIDIQTPTPQLDLKGSIELELSGLKRIWPQLETANLDGRANIQALYQGSSAGWEEAKFNFTARVPRLSFFHYTLDDAYLTLDQPGKHLTKLSFTAAPYGGKLNSKSIILLNQPNIPVSLWAQFTGVNLAQLRRDVPWKNREMSGTLAAEISLNGELRQLRKTTGKGSLSIQDGNIWQFQLLKGIWGNLLLTPEFENIVFTDARSVFQIRDQRITTNNFVMQSKPVDLVGGGWINFDRGINFVVRPNFRESEVLGSPSLKQVPTAILTQLVQDNVAIKISGSLNQPKYEKTILPIKILQNTTSSILEGLQGIFENLIEK